MGKKLVIVESPAKAKTINRILGRGYVVKSSVGHVRDLPVKSLGVDIKNDFSPKYVVVKGKRKVIDELKKAVKDSDEVYLAPDPDREGEAIAWHLQALLDDPGETRRFLRVQYNEVTPSAVRRAFEAPGEIDLNRVNAQQARRVLDRIVGYMVSPMLWRRLQRGLSAGRVQSVALRLVCEREHEIRGFVPEVYWIMGAVVRKLVMPLDPFNVRLVSIDGEKADIKSAEQADRIRAELDGRRLRVKDVGTRDVQRRPPPPFITSTLQQAGSSHHGLSPQRTMMIAQRLYEGIDLGEGPVGLITYMRTDSFSVAQDAMHSCREYVERTFGEAFRPEKPNVYRSRASAQGAHEAIRPTDVTRTPQSMAGRLEPAQHKIYTLVWERFVASQMSAATVRQRTVDIEAQPPADGGTQYGFRATASEVVFPGYMKVAGMDKRSKAANKDEGDVDNLPGLAPDEPLECLEWLSERKETTPPPRYSEASLVNALEKNGVGRPSTYALILATLQQRKYVRREKRTLFPTDLGMQVSELLVASLDELFNVKFTASMESSLDKVEDGSVEWTAMLGEFFERFEKWMEGTREPGVAPERVKPLLSAFEQVGEWAPPVKRGRRTYSDERFVTSIRDQLEKGERPISQRQIEALARIGLRYREQAPEIEQAVAAAGCDALLAEPEPQAPRDTTMKKFEILAGVSLDEAVVEFVTSLREQAQSGRRLSDAQLRALDKILVAHGSLIEGFDALKETLGVTVAAPEDHESGALLDALSAVKEWKPPVKRGRRTFDDADFFRSLSEQHARKGFLSVRQRAAMKRMLRRYREQIPDYEAVAERCGLQERKEDSQQQRGEERVSD